ncbi:MAG: DciA family protein [Thiomonas sp.]|nr:DciA family protein [Thiomonas sp.]
MSRHRPPFPAASLQKGAGSLSAWAQVTLPIAALRDAALLSRRMWDAAQQVLPIALSGGVQPGRLQEGIWSLTASSSAVAAKLSQFKPTVLRHLQESGFTLRDIRIRVQPQGERTARAAQPQSQGPTCPTTVKARLRALLAKAD